MSERENGEREKETKEPFYASVANPGRGLDCHVATTIGENGNEVVALVLCFDAFSPSEFNGLENRNVHCTVNG